MHVRSFCLLTFALPSLAALALPPAVHAADCAAALRIALPNARITAASAVPSNDSLRALGQKSYCRVEATVDTETHIVALLPDDSNGRFLMGGGGGYAGSVENRVRWRGCDSLHEADDDFDTRKCGVEKSDECLTIGLCCKRVTTMRSAREARQPRQLHALVRQ